MFVCLYIYLYVCVPVHIPLCSCACTYTSMFVCLYLYVRVPVPLCSCVCTYKSAIMLWLYTILFFFFFFFFCWYRHCHCLCRPTAAAAAAAVVVVNVVVSIVIVVVAGIIVVLCDFSPCSCQSSGYDFKWKFSSDPVTDYSLLTITHTNYEASNDGLNFDVSKCALSDSNGYSQQLTEAASVYTAESGHFSIAELHKNTSRALLLGNICRRKCSCYLSCTTGYQTFPDGSPHPEISNLGVDSMEAVLELGEIMHGEYHRSHSQKICIWIILV